MYVSENEKKLISLKGLNVQLFLYLDLITQYLSLSIASAHPFE